ncbi:hypothetical protein BJV78DRAFT_1360519 [Lactifluus subvellereus]|nr:hypothetical protein BJV78DRAFT_1360519 [Lactifluus subvellereus]
MFSKAFLLSLLVAAVVAAPAPSMNDGATPSAIQLKSNVSCTGIISSGVNATPLPSVILLNNPSATPPTSPSPYGNYAAPPQASINPSIINLNAPAASPSIINLIAPAAAPSIIKLNRRQFSSTSSTSTFSFGGIVPSSAALASSFSPATPTTSSFSFGGIVTSSSPSPASTTAPNPVVSNGPSTFTSTGADGVKTVLLLSTVTVTETGPACSPPPAFNPGSALVPPVSSSAAPSSSPPSLSPFLGNNVQTPSAIPTSSLSIIDLNTPSVTSTPATGFSFSSTAASSTTPAPFPVNAASPTSCDFSCLLTASV